MIRGERKVHIENHGDLEGVRDGDNTARGPAKRHLITLDKALEKLGAALWRLGVHR